ncbi:MAG TPA: MmgE/PrpD family protein [Syntrophorhabdaceae bacterium]|nr:MmgE/PrpD family protein [Syntrophorhabdaceae bacterium]
MGMTEELVQNIVRTEFDSIDAEFVDRAKWRIIDATGCLIAGANAIGCRETSELVRKWGGTGESTVLVHGIKSPAYNAAMVNSLMTRSFDFEPVEAEGENRTGPAHISGTTVPTAFAVAEKQGASGKDLITALIIGDDLAARLSVASGFDFALGWDNTGTINAFGATAIACKLLRLSEKEVRNALGIVLSQLSGTMDCVWDKVMTFKLCIALSARNGIFSAELAGSGFTGVKDPFLGKHGYFSLYCSNHDTSDLIRNLGKRFYADCAIKPYSACRATHSSIDAALMISQSNDIQPDAVEEITVRLPARILNGFTGQPFVLGDTPQIDGTFSVRYTVATALLRKGVKPAYFSDECLHDPLILQLINRMKLIESPEATEVEVRMKDGTTLSGHTVFPKGDIVKTPLTFDEIRAKFRDNVAYSQTIPVATAEKVLEMLEDLENIKDIREVIRLLV